jgi:hypothetical protein
MAPINEHLVRAETEAPRVTLRGISASHSLTQL